jgi:hypothetical protein
MSLSSDLDTWAATLDVNGLPVTRDPARVYPPCIYMELPESVSGTLPSLTLDVPVYIVAAGEGKQAGDQLLDNITAFIEATKVKQLTPETLSISQTDYHAYKATVRVYLDTTPPN